MPADFDDIADYHSRLAARYQELAQEARDRGSRGEAEYLAAQAARYAEAAEEQRRATQQEPGPADANRTPHHPWPSPEPEPPAATGFLAVLRGAGHIATVLHRSASKRSEPFHGLSLH